LYVLTATTRTARRSHSYDLQFVRGVRTRRVPKRKSDLTSARLFAHAVLAFGWKLSRRCPATTLSRRAVRTRRRPIVSGQIRCYYYYCVPEEEKRRFFVSENRTRSLFGRFGVFLFAYTPRVSVATAVSVSARVPVCTCACCRSADGRPRRRPRDPTRPTDTFDLFVRFGAGFVGFFVHRRLTIPVGYARRGKTVRAANPRRPESNRQRTPYDRRERCSPRRDANVRSHKTSLVVRHGGACSHYDKENKTLLKNITTSGRQIKTERYTRKYT